MDIKLFTVNDCKINEWYREIVGSEPELDWGDNAVKLIEHVVGGAESGFHEDYVKRLKTLVTAAQNQDWLMHLTNKIYRDHKRHQCRVAILGWRFLHSKIKYYNTSADNPAVPMFIEYALDQYNSAERDPEQKLKQTHIKTAWVITSLLHDHAYPLAHLAKSMIPLRYLSGQNYKKDLDNFMNFIGTYHALFANELCDIFLDPKTLESIDERHKLIVAIMRERLCDYKVYLPENDGSLDVYDHGLWSALNLAANVRAWGVPPEQKVESTCFKIAIQAIALHNCYIKGSTAGISVEENPLAFLLLLVDELQEWGRELLLGDELKIPCNKIEFENFSFGEADEWPKDLSVRFVFDNSVTDKIKWWDYDRFVDDKIKKFQYLKVPDNFPIQKRSFSLHYEVP